MDIKIVKNGIRGTQKYAVTAKFNGASFKIHTNCDCIKTANTIKRNLQNLLAALAVGQGLPVVA